MAREEIIRELERLKDEKFMLNMVDRWSDRDYTRNWELIKEINKLEKMLDN